MWGSLLFPIINSFIVELRRVLHQSNLLVSAMIHFITQLQYYITFEVCSLPSHTADLYTATNSVGNVPCVCHTVSHKS